MLALNEMTDDELTAALRRVVDQRRQASEPRRRILATVADRVLDEMNERVERGNQPALG